MTNQQTTSNQAEPSALFIGIDLGTSGCRAMAINASGAIKAEAKYDYPNQNQESPQQWWLASQKVLRQLLTQVDTQDIKSIAVDGTSSTVFLCNDSGEPLTPVLMYHDQRAKSQVLELKDVVPPDSVVLNPSSSLAKIFWLLENHPPKINFHIVHQADWLAGKLCADFNFNFSDVNNVLKMGFDASKHIWPEWLLDLFAARKINTSSLPKVFIPGESVAKINPQLAHELGLPLEVDIIAGTTDSTAAFIASTHNETHVGQAVTSLGSSLVLKVVSDKPINDPVHGVYSQPYGQHWLVGGASNSGGAVLQHYFTNEQMLQLTKKIKPEIETKLNYYPLIKPGERFPINDPNMQPRVTPAAKNEQLFFQGLLEGIAEIEHKGYKLLEKLGAPYPSSVTTNGGGAINQAWLKIRTKKMAVPVISAKHSAAAYGAALLAAKNYQ